LALGPRQALSRQTAWGCLTTNLTLPGFGSLVAGRVVGYGQAALSLGGTAITMVFGVRFILWFLANWSRLHDVEGDAMGGLVEMWGVLRWPLLGIGIFLIGWIWALGTSLQIIQAAKKSERPMAPPKL
jgi:hypothetical protein